MAGPLILLADDEAHITCVVAQKLRSAGFAVATARDGAEAYEIALKSPPALVVTDLQMPRLSGLELAVRLRQNASTSLTPVMMLTARGYIVDQATLSVTNIRHLMAKPFSARDLLKRTIELIGEPASDSAAGDQAEAA